MPALEKNLRTKLENTVKAAREVAEAGARSSLEQIGVGDAEAPKHLSEKEKDLRRRLRIHGRQLGDEPGEKKAMQTIERLVEEVAYEHWHRLLFASFLAENKLLMYPDPDEPVAVTISECDDMAADEGARNGWELAARYAARMLPQIFRINSPVFELELPPESQQELEKLVSSLPKDVHIASDSLGWVYQFWQVNRKEAINKSAVSIGSRELPAVTQLFTEDYMVDFLLDNTLGAWHAGKVFNANPTLSKVATTEQEIRDSLALPGCPWSYLRFLCGNDGVWRPAAGTFDDWPKTASDLRCLDPCMGSGHFVVAMFERLIALRLSEEASSEADAVAGVIRDNLYGLEIDPRCTQIAAFNVALAAWRRVGYRTLPAMNLACSGLAPNVSESEWIALAGDSEKLLGGMTRLYQLFQKAAVVGSLINPRAEEGDLLEAGFSDLEPLLEKVLVQEAKDDTSHEMAVTARGLAKAVEILSDQFTLVATNVPFLKRGYQEKGLSDWIEHHYEIGKANIATAMLMRANELAKPGGSVALVIQQSWLYQSTQRSLREQMLSSCCWNFLARLGPGAFDTISGEVVNVALLTLTRLKKCNPTVSGIDAYSDKGSGAKAFRLREGLLVSLDQAAQSRNPQSTVMFPGATSGSKLIGEFCELGKGSVTGDSPHFIRQFWEQRLSVDWQPWLNTPQGSLFSGRHQVVYWQNDGELVRREKGVAIRGQNVWGGRGFLVGKTSFAAGIYLGEMFDDNTGVLAPSSEVDLAALLCFSASDEFEEAIRDVDQELKVTIGNFGKITVDIDYWRTASSEKYPNGLPKPFSSDATQWLFNGHPAAADQSLQVAVARLVGYLWPRQTGSSFPDCPAIDADGLESHADKDGIVCIPPVRGEASGSDRLLNLLAAAYGSEWNGDLQNRLLADAGYAGKNLETWLRDGFFSEHIEVFHKRPFVWQIWDGLSDGFSALVNYHKLDHKNLEMLIHTYLGDWISRCESEDKAKGLSEDGEKTKAAKNLKRKLELILEGQAPYDIFVRWKPLHEQPIGWNPDINDGVRINIRPFVSVPDVKAKGAGVLRVNPKIKWDKDRGKEPERSKQDYPWFWGWDEKTTDFNGGSEFKVDRFNDCHYTLAAKQRARESSK